MGRRRTLALLIVTAALLTGCVPEPGTDSAPTPSAASTSPSASPSTTASSTPTPAVTPVSIPTDCRGMLTEDVLAQLGSTPLNDPAMGLSTGVQSDGSLVCLWRDPRADTTTLTTTISAMSSGPALDLMNQLADEQGFTCYTPDGGTRCEKTWINEIYPVTDGRTLFWRDDIMIDTQFSNLAPTGYTAAVVSAVFG